MAVTDKKDGPKAIRPGQNLTRVFERAADFHAQYFPIEIGIDPQKYVDLKSSGYAGVKFYAEQGAIHGAYANVQIGDDRAVTVSIEHWVHRPNGDNIQTPFLTLKAVPAESNGQNVMRITECVLQGESLNLDDRRVVDAVASTCQQILETLRLERRMPLLGSIAERAGLKAKPLPNSYKDGNARLAYEEGRKNITRTLRIPEHFVPAVTGFFQQGYAARPQTPVIFPAVMRGEGKNPPQYHMRAEYLKPAVAGSTNIDIGLSRKNDQNANSYEMHGLASLRFRRASGAGAKGMVDLASVAIGGRPQRVTDHKNMVRALHFVHDSMLDLREGLIPDLGDIISYTNTQRAFSGVLPLTKKEGRRFTTRVLGGNPTDEGLSSKEKGIGANCFADHYEYFDAKGNLVTESLVRDVGIMTLDRDKTGYDGKMPFAGDYFPHRDNPKHTPKYNAKALFVTHWHYDHDGGVPHLLLAGYRIDHLICNQATKMHIEDICKKLDVPKEWLPAKWTVIDDLIENKEELQLSKNMTLQFGWTPHSAPTNWIFVKTPEGSLFHFSDAKFDQTVESNPVFDVDHIRTLKPTIVSVDSTRVAFEGPVKRESDVRAEMVDFINKNPEKAPVTVHIGTNAARMVTTVDAYGETGRDTVVFGASMRFTKKVLDKVGRRNGMGLKQYAARAFGREILNYTANAVGANRILQGDVKGQALLITGTHNEPMSIVNRLIEDNDQKNLGFMTPQKYKFILSQTGIPGSERGYRQLVDFLERRGYEYVISHASGHGGRDDIREMLKMVGARYGIVTHGDKTQRKSSASLIDELGMKSIDPSEQDVMQISDQKGCTIIGQEKSMMTFFTIKRPLDQHYGGGEDVEYFTQIVPPEIKTPVGEIIEEIADIRSVGGEEVRRLSLRRAQREDKDATLNIEGVDLRPKKRRVTVSLPDYYIQNGFMRGITYDTETTQLGKYAWIRQFAARQHDMLDPQAVKWANYYHVLPRTILPDLNALLVTGVKPSQLYAEPEGSCTKEGSKIYLNPPDSAAQVFPTRLFYLKIKEFLENSKRVSYQTEEGKVLTTTRMWIDTAVKPDDPSVQKRQSAGDKAYETQTVTFSLNPLDKMTAPRMVNIKTMLEGANIFNADNVWMQHLAFQAGDLRYSPMNSGGIRSSDIRSKARMFAYLRPDKFKVRTKPDNPEFLDFTVQGLVAANKIAAPKGTRAHEGQGDVIMEKALDDLMRVIDPELYTRMAMNANPKEVKKYFAGSHNGMVYPRHLLTYVNRNAFEAKANIGVYVGRSTDRRYMNKAVLFNVSDFDPKEFLNMGPHEIAEIMSDRTHRLHKAFEIVQINKQPLIASVDRGLAVKANRGTSLEQMKAYKHFIEREPEIAANMVKAMEIARALPDHDHRLPLEERIYAPEFMEMSAHDKALAKLFIPCAFEFENETAAHSLNKDRAAALDKFHSKQLRERYVTVMYQVERESEMLFGKARRYLHPTDHARIKAREKARIHGRGDNGAMSLGRLQKQIADTKENWDTLVKDKSPKEKSLMKEILSEAETLARFIDERIHAGDPDWALTQDDLKLLGLDDNINYGDYTAPLARNPHARKAPKLKVA